MSARAILRRLGFGDILDMLAMTQEDIDAVLADNPIFPDGEEHPCST